MRLFWHHALPYASSNDLNVCRCLGAVFSGKRFLASVWKHVTLQTIWVTASVVALLTGKEFVSSVRGLVIPEMTSTIARIVALLTYEMPFPWTNGSALCILRFWGVVRVLLHCEQPKGCVNKRLPCWMGEQVFFEVISLCTWVLSSCIVCKQRISLPSVWACVSWGSQPVCRRSCTVCKQQASLQCELAYPQSLFYFVPQEISQPSRIGFCEPEHVSFQFGSTGGWVAAQVAAVGLLSTMLNHVHFEIFCHLEGEITLKTWVRSVFSLYFNFHGWFSGQALQWCCLINKAAQLRGDWR